MHGSVRSGNVIGAESIAIDSNGDIIITGHFVGTVDFGNGNVVTSKSIDYGHQADFFLVKYHPDGTLVWLKNISTDTCSIMGKSVGVDSNNNIYVGGVLTGTVNFGSGEINVGDSLTTFLVKYSSSGNLLWANTTILLNAGNMHKMTVEPNGDITFLGYYQGVSRSICGQQLPYLSPTGSGYYLAKFSDSDSGPVCKWVKLLNRKNGESVFGVTTQGFSGPGRPQLPNIGIDNQGNTILTGGAKWNI